MKRKIMIVLSLFIVVACIILLKLTYGRTPIMVALVFVILASTKVFCDNIKVTDSKYEYIVNVLATNTPYYIITVRNKNSMKHNILYSTATIVDETFLDELKQNGVNNTALTEWKVAPDMYPKNCSTEVMLKDVLWLEGRLGEYQENGGYLNE